MPQETSLGRQNADFFDAEDPEMQTTPETAEQEVDFIIKNAPLDPGSKVLDVPCGEGHHSQVLTEKYALEVTGIDGGETLIERAHHRYSKPHFVHAYFEALEGPKLVEDESQDAVMCINHSFGYLPTAQENQTLLNNMYKKLKPGGVLVIQTDFNPHIPQRQKLTAGESKRVGKILYLDEEDGPFVEQKLPTEYRLNPEDETFRDLSIINSRWIKEDGSLGSRKKYANYLVVKDDGNVDVSQRKPVDMPVLRALAHHNGIEDSHIEFYSEPYVSRERLFHRCMLLIRKPIPQKDAVEEIKGAFQEALTQKF